MEQEYKWQYPSDCCPDAVAQHSLIQNCCTNTKQYQMQAVYYDTENALFRHLGGSLRLRRENQTSVCCMKITRKKEGALAIREEYETEAETLAEGLQKLPQVGAPADICTKISPDALLPLCTIAFVRNAMTLEISTENAACVAELALDSGTFQRNGITQDFMEVELEFKSGSPEAFHTFAKQIETTFSLIPQPLSKLARALSIS